MKTITIATQKGGAGKSTVTAHLAVEFLRANKTVAILDLDKQGSIGFWREQREAEHPQVLQITFAEFEAYQKHCSGIGFDYLLVDTPPHAGAGIEVIARKSDLVIVPLRPGPLDIAAVGATVEFLVPKKALFLLNQVPSVGSEGQQARELLNTLYPQISVAGTHLGLRKSYSTALISGLSITEFEKPGTKAFKEIEALFNEIMEKI